jgi:hypothetical protein
MHDYSKKLIMKTNLIFLLLFFPFLGLTQKKKYSLEGRTYYLSEYQGGVENPPVQASPKGYVTLYVVELFADKRSRKVMKLVSRVDGRFKVYLPPGEYGFVLKEDLTSLVIGQYLPKGYQTGGMMKSFRSFWNISDSRPVKIIDKDIQGIRITNFETETCGMCP